MPAVQVARRLQIYHAEWIEITLVNLHRQNKVPLKIVTEMSCFCRVINDVTFAEKNMQLFFSAQCNGHSVTAQETDVSESEAQWSPENRTNQDRGMKTETANGYSYIRRCCVVFSQTVFCWHNCFILTLTTSVHFCDTACFLYQTWEEGIVSVI